MNLTKSLLLLIVITVSSIYSNTNSNSIEIEIDNLKSSKGSIRVSLYNKLSAEYFPSNSDKAFKIYKFGILRKKSKFILKDVPFGEYAISIHHDEDGNNELNTNWIGMPKEGLGASNNAKGSFGPPKYAQAMFRHTKNTKLSIELYYP